MHCLLAPQTIVLAYVCPRTIASQKVGFELVEKANHQEEWQDSPGSSHRVPLCT